MEDLVSLLEDAKQLEVKGEYKKAEKAYTSLIEQAKQSKGSILDINIITDALNHRGIARRMLMDYDGAFEDFEDAMTNSMDGERVAFAYIGEADIYRVRDKNFGSAHVSLDEALSYAENGSLVHAKATDQRGLVFVGQAGQAEQQNEDKATLANYELAIASYQRAREICEELMKPAPEDKDIENRFGQIMHHLGTAYVRAKDPEKVDEAYESQITALNIFKKLGDQEGIVNSVATLGRIASIKTDYDEAIKQYKQAWKVLEQTKYGRAITGLSLDLAEAYLNKSQSFEAIPYLERFVQGIFDNEVTGHDINLMRDQYDRVAHLCEQKDLSSQLKRVDNIFHPSIEAMLDPK